jgi:hypothetical protein
VAPHNTKVSATPARPASTPKPRLRPKVHLATSTPNWVATYSRNHSPPRRYDATQGSTGTRQARAKVFCTDTARGNPATAKLRTPSTDAELRSALALAKVVRTTPATGSCRL